MRLLNRSDRSRAIPFYMSILAILVEWINRLQKLVGMVCVAGRKGDAIAVV